MQNGGQWGKQGKINICAEEKGGRRNEKNVLPPYPGSWRHLMEAFPKEGLTLKSRDPRGGKTTSGWWG